MAKKPTEEPVAEESLDDYEAYSVALAEKVWGYNELDFVLNVEEHLFVRSYVIDRNEVAALRRLGHTGESATLKARAKRYLRNSEVQGAIDFLAKQMMGRLEITAERVQRQIAAVAFFDPREVMNFDRTGVSVINSRLWTAEQMAAVQSVKMGQFGVEIKMYDRLRAAEMLAKQLGVQREDNSVEDAFRIAADQAMDKLSTVLSRMLPGGKGVQQSLTQKDPVIIEGKVN